MRYSCAMATTTKRILSGFVIACPKGCGTFDRWTDIRYCPTCGAFANIRAKA